MDKESGSGFEIPWSQGAIIALLLGIGSFFFHDAPYVSDRRADSPQRGEQQFTGQDVDARLWQDPLGVVQRAHEPSKPASGEAAASAPPPTPAVSSGVFRCLPQEEEPAASAASNGAAASAPAVAASSPVLQHDVRCLRRELDRLHDPKLKVGTLVLAVMVRGGPYSDFVEQRRRARYAVLSGLNETGYEPTDAEHLGWVARPSGDGMMRQLPEFIPFEWFDRHADWAAKERRREETPLGRILVLWLDDRAFTENPIALMRVLAKEVAPDKDTGWRIIGPVRSDALRAMVLETQRTLEAVNHAEGQAASQSASSGPPLHFYAATPTVPDDTLMDGIGCYVDNCLAAYLQKNSDVSFVRTIANDSQLVHALIDELRLRGLRPIKLAGTKGAINAKSYRNECLGGSHVAVVAEWDTLYGRSLRKFYKADYGVEGYCVENFNYMRGLDGLLPGRAEAAPENEGAGQETSGGKQDDRRKDGSFIERAEGQSQFDYLRRLAKAMRDRDDELRSTSPDGQGLRAIGVLGNDLHDKLLVMQALRPEFPNALFFTNDLDARYLHPREQQWTRNLIVASSFGFQLERELQGGVPPFRDGYETSQFFATLLLVDAARHNLSGRLCGEPGKPKCEEGAHEWRQADLDHWLRVPRVFEMGRTRAFEFKVDDPGETPKPSQKMDEDGVAAIPGRDDKSCRADRLSKCPDIHPPVSERAPVPDGWGRWLSWFVLLSAFWIPVLLLFPERCRNSWNYVRCKGLATKGQRWRRIAILALLGLVLFGVIPGLLAWAWPFVADWMTDDGKPLVFTEGVSTWPTEFIRLFTFLLGGYLLLRAWRGLVENQESIDKEFFIKHRRAKAIDEQEKGEAKLPLHTRLWNMFLWSSVRPPVNSDSVDANVEKIWRRHAVQNRLVARLVRTTTYVVVALALTGVVCLSYHEAPFVPQRGQLSLYVHTVLHYLVFLMLYFVVFFVVDATVLCVSFIRYLHKPSRIWPPDAVEHFMKVLNIRDSDLIQRWIGLKLVEARTEEINQLVYYPFILLSLVLLSRSPVIDVWQMPTSGVVLTVCGVIVAMLCARFLRWSAEKARRVMLDELDEALVRGNASTRPASSLRLAAAPSLTATPRQIELLREQTASLRRGAFAPYSQQPLLKALLLPFATLGGTTLLEYLQLANNM